MDDIKTRHEEYEIIRGSVDENQKYCRIPIQSRIAKTMQQDGMSELNAEIILNMPHDQAVRTIDAIIEDWRYWLNRANELFILSQSSSLKADDAYTDD